MKVHLGCGKRCIPGFTHVDLADFPHIDFKHDIRTLPFLANDSAELMYACHVLEYFDRVEVADVLHEWWRVLAPGGGLYLAVPDIEALFQVYAKHRDFSLIQGPIYGRWPIPGGDGVIYHRTGYDFESLRCILESNGFTDVRRYDWRATVFKDYDDYSQAYIPHMDKTNGVLISLNVMCRKPEQRAVGDTAVK